jgi:hypothetical protein
VLIDGAIAAHTISAISGVAQHLSSTPLGADFDFGSPQDQVLVLGLARISGHCFGLVVQCLL